MNDTVVLKDVLRDYEGQEAHTVHLVFTPKFNRNPSKFDNQSSRQSSANNSNQTSTSNITDTMSTSELRQRHTASTTTVPSPSANTDQSEQLNSNAPNIPSNYFNAFYGSGNPADANSFLAQQYAMQAWMQQAYTNYMNQYMSLLQSQQGNMFPQQPNQQPQNFAFIPPQMPFASPPNLATSTAAASPVTNEAAPNNEVPQAAPAPVAEEPQRRFPNIIQDEQENRDWLDILYSMSRLMILLCLVYFYSSPIRCLVVIMVGVTLYLYHVYKQNEIRLNNNNIATRENLNNLLRAVQAANAAARENGENAENAESNETPEGASVNNQEPAAESPAEPLIDQAEPTVPQEPQVPLLTVVRTFVLSFFSSIIPDAPAL